jgi:hypothetical protein
MMSSSYNYTFRDGGQFIDLDAVVAALDLA